MWYIAALSVLLSGMTGDVWTCITSDFMSCRDMHELDAGVGAHSLCVNSDLVLASLRSESTRCTGGLALSGLSAEAQ